MGGREFRLSLYAAPERLEGAQVLVEPNPGPPFPLSKGERFDRVKPLCADPRRMPTCALAPFAPTPRFAPPLCLP